MQLRAKIELDRERNDCDGRELAAGLAEFARHSSGWA